MIIHLLIKCIIIASGSCHLTRLFGVPWGFMEQRIGLCPLLCAAGSNTHYDSCMLLLLFVHDGSYINEDDNFKSMSSILIF